MASSLFRQEAIDAGRNKLTGTVIAAVPPSSRLYTGLLLAVVVAMIAFLSVGSFAKKAQVRGAVTYSVNAASVVAPRAGKIVELNVREGQRVEKGTVVATLQIAQGRDSGGEGIASQLAEIDTQYRELERQKSLSEALGQSEVGSLKTQRAGLTQSLASLERQKALVASQIRLLEDKYQRSVRLAKQGASTKQEVEDRQADVLARKLDLEAINERLISQRETLRTVEAQIGSRAIGTDQSGSEIVQRMSALAEERARLMREDKLQLTAPMAGLVGDLPARAGVDVRDADIVATVIPEQSQLEVELFAPTSAVGFVKAGQDVRLMFDAFPYQKYGTGSGTVTWVSPVPTELPEGFAAPAPANEPMFRVKVRLDLEGQKDRIFAERLRAGMTLSANLILENRSLWSVIFDPVLRAIRS
ncbi:MAG: HlyD family efflux transporter periplasmic adaptor subunit [Sphingomonadales bacterium]|nr:MAG: HlyD family efflux transporter periplasmic adaptor subunit [Sphingomonadales bacterium]